MYHVAYQISWENLKILKKNISFVYFQNTFIQSFFSRRRNLKKTNDPGHPAQLLIRQNILNKCFSSSSAFVERHSLHSEILETLILPEFRHESRQFGLDMRVELYRTLQPIFFFEKLFWKELLDTLMWSKNWKCLKPYMQKSSLDLLCCGKIKLELNMKIWPFHFKRKILAAFNSHNNSLSKSNYSNGRDYQLNRSCIRIRKHVFLSRFQTTYYLEQL